MTPKEQLKKLMEEKNFKRYPNFPKAYLPPAKKSKSPSNELTNNIIKHITLVGGWASRINSMGRVLDGKYIPGSTKKGTFDIISCIKGKFVGIEIKIKDKLSEDQIRVHSDVDKAGGIAIVCHNFDEWIKQYNKLICT